MQERDIIRPEIMTAFPTQPDEPTDYVTRSCVDRPVPRVCQDPDAPVLREGACCPVLLPFSSEPVMSCVMIDVRTVEQGHKDVHIRQGCHECQSRSLLTSSRPGAAPARRVKTRTPFRVPPFEDVSVAFCMSSEMIVPSGMPLCRDSKRAFSSASGSRFTVVLISQVFSHHASDVKHHVFLVAYENGDGFFPD